MSVQGNPGVCPHCSARLPDGIVFCTRCGKSLDIASEFGQEVPAQEEKETSDVLSPEQKTPSAPPTPFALLQKEIEYLDQQYPWNLISLACVWAFLFITYFV